MERSVAAFYKNSREQIRVVLKEYHGHEIIDIRVWWTKDGIAWFPSKKGLAIRTEKLPVLLGVLHRAAELTGEDLEQESVSDADDLLSSTERAELGQMFGVDPNLVEELAVE